MTPVLGYASIAAVTIATVLIGFFGVRISRTTSDFYVASRTVRPWLNASAIGGEYLSAASVLGVAGLILLQGSARCGSRSATPRATSCCCCSSRRRCGARAPTRCPTSPRRGSSRAGCGA
ncbi:hypothetical protein GCM10025869_13270 [Homoserinibacter gongjuensis]|uniref:Uncharacterized protein n=1 Tax=Homoserinibacter gongjuensis TaxID=1162968 RepID=A0ABQ6JTS2_9MICO|nr:hypothetical protein GCM10025869_13270 [Homoserinibacter gongjuensis]